LDIDDICSGSAHSILLAADGDLHEIPVNRCCGVKASSDVAILGLLVETTVLVGGVGGERHALSDLYESGVALGCLHLLNAIALAVGVAANDADLIATSCFTTPRANFGVADDNGAIDTIAAICARRRILCVHTDEQALGLAVQLR